MSIRFQDSEHDGAGLAFYSEHSVAGLAFYTADELDPATACDATVKEAIGNIGGIVIVGVDKHIVPAAQRGG
jgi:hypothetical protein